MNDNALIVAVRANDIQRVRELIRSGVDVNAFGHDGRTALHFAAWDGSVECVQVCCCCISWRWRSCDANVLCVSVEKLLLVEGKANVEAKECIGWTPLMSAADGGHCDCVQVRICVLFMVIGEHFTHSRVVCVWANKRCCLTRGQM